MSKTTLLGVTLLSLISSQAAAQTSFIDRTEPTAMMTVRVYDYASVSTWISTQAEQAMNRIYRQVGIELLWQDRSFCLAQPQAEQCQKPLRPTDLVLRILPKAMAEKQQLSQTTMGWALGNFQAYIFHDRVEKQARLARIAHGDMLGYAIAHEIGHLLLGSNAHSVAGIMKAKWDREHLERAEQQLLFLQQQAESIRCEVRRRGGQEFPLQIPGLTLQARPLSACQEFQIQR